MRASLIALFLLVPGLWTASAQQGTWCWWDAGDAWGLQSIIGVDEREAAAVREFTGKPIGWVYGAVQNLPVSAPETMAAWNHRLHQNGLSSFLLLSENTWIFPEIRGQLTTNLIRFRLVEFNAGRTNADERFDGLHLDIEPQGLDEWSAATAERKRELLLLLADTYRDVRHYLVSTGCAEAVVCADLPVWFDNLGGSIGWLSEADRNQWFADLSTNLTGVSLMAFERTSFASISNGVSWELTNMTCAVRVALEADVGAARTWTNFAAFTALCERIKFEWGYARGPDLQSFRQHQTAAPSRAARLSGAQQQGFQLAAQDFFPGRTSRIERADVSGNAWTTCVEFISWQAEHTWVDESNAAAAGVYRVIGE